MTDYRFLKTHKPEREKLKKYAQDHGMSLLGLFHVLARSIRAGNPSLKND